MPIGCKELALRAGTPTQETTMDASTVDNDPPKTRRTYRLNNITALATPCTGCDCVPCECACDGCGAPTPGECECSAIRGEGDDDAMAPMHCAPRPCGQADCAVSSGIHEGLTFGCGHLDRNGYWERPCRTCAAAWDAANPNSEYGPAWPFDRGGVPQKFGGP